jgi:hypothetical protein
LEVTFKGRQKVFTESKYYSTYTFGIREIFQSLDKAQFNIDKRFSDFIDLMKQLTNDNKNVTYPELPTRYHLMKEDLDKRGRELEEFLSIILNDKKFCGQQVLEFLDLDTHQCGILLGKQEVNLISKFNFVIQVNGYVKQTTDGYNNDPFVAWKIYVKVTGNIFFLWTKNRFVAQCQCDTS